MKRAELKILAGMSIVESDVSKKNKIKLLDFVKEEASIYQMMGFILDHEMYDLNKSQEKKVKQRFIKEIDEEKRKTYMSAAGISSGGLYAGGKIAKRVLQGRGVGGVPAIIGTTIFFSGGAAIWAAYKGVRSIFDKCSKQCGTLELNDKRRQLCMKKCKENYDREVSKLKVKAAKIQKTRKRIK